MDEKMVLISEELAIDVSNTLERRGWGDSIVMAFRTAPAGYSRETVLGFGNHCAVRPSQYPENMIDQYLAEREKE